MQSRFFSRGLLYSFGIVVNRVIPARLFRFRVFDIHQLECPVAAATSAFANDELHFQWCATDHDFQLAEQHTRYHSAQRDVPAADACLVTRDETLIAALWRTTGNFPESELGLRIVLGDDNAWIFAAYVDQAHRGGGVYRRLLTQVLRDRPSGGTYAAINPTNRASLAAHRRFIKRTVGRCWSIRVGSCAAAWVTGELELDRHLSCDPNRPISLHWH